MRLLRLVALTAGLLAAGCATTQTYSPDTAPEYTIIRAYTPFYRNGPAQSQVQGQGMFRADAALPAATRVKLIRQESGYSLVMLDDGRTGYVANENMTVAPPRPPAPPSVGGTSVADGSRGGRKHKGDSPRYNGEQVNDTPLPEAPPPDLNVAPEDIPAAPSPTPAPPAEKPRFRY